MHRWSWQAEGVDGPRRGVAGSDGEVEWPQEAGRGLSREGIEQVRLGVGLRVAYCSPLQTVKRDDQLATCWCMPLQK